MPRKHILSVMGFLFVVALVVAPAVIHYRLRYDYTKRLRVVVPGKLYRSGQLSEAGFRETVRELGLKTIINLQDEAPEPVFDTGRLESDVCKELGLNYVFIAPDLLPRRRALKERPVAVESYLKIMDEAASYPVLLHCRAGLHRTGTLVALYRIEYDGWTPVDAIRELQANGFGRTESTARNDYLNQYLLLYHPRDRAARGSPAAVTAKD